jgi:uncharacterized protein YggT (Ycf19 family)
MIILSFFNNLNVLTNPFIKNEFTIYIIHNLAIFLVNIVSYAYVLVKFYKVLCYSKMTFEWLPMINPYVWPFSLFQVLTGPYFKFWSKILPNVKFEKSSVEVSGIIALEALNSFIYFCTKCISALIPLLEELEKTLSN